MYRLSKWLFQGKDRKSVYIVQTCRMRREGAPALSVSTVRSVWCNEAGDKSMGQMQWVDGEMLDLIDELNLH